LQEVRKLFDNIQVTPAADVNTNWLQPDEPKLIQILMSLGMKEKQARASTKKLVKFYQVGVVSLPHFT
jgi:hypothetical protein